MNNFVRIVFDARTKLKSIIHLHYTPLLYLKDGEQNCRSTSPIQIWICFRIAPDRVGARKPVQVI